MYVSNFLATPNFFKKTLYPISSTPLNFDRVWLLVKIEEKNYKIWKYVFQHVAMFKNV